jgi:hypothetical protein
LLVFERGGFVHVYRSPQDAAGSIESIDLQEGRYLGAFSDRGEVIEMGPGDLFATFTATGRLDREALASLIRQSGGPWELADRADDYAMAILQQGGSRY